MKISGIWVFVIILAAFGSSSRSVVSAGWTDPFYVCTAYGDWAGQQTVENGSPYVQGWVADTGFQCSELSVDFATKPEEWSSTIYLYGFDGEWDIPDVYPQESCGLASGTVTGRFTPSKYPAGTSMYLHLSVSVTGSPVGNWEGGYFEIKRADIAEAPILARIDLSSSPSATIVVKAGEPIAFTIYAAEDDFYPNAWQTSYSREFVFTCRQGDSLFHYPINQSRSVSASNSRGASDGKSVVDIGPFNRSAGVSWGSYSAAAQQNSTIGTSRITANGSANDLNPFYHNETYSQTSASRFHVEFELDRSYTLTLTGTLDAYGDYGGTCSGSYEARFILSSQTAGTIFSASKKGWDLDWNPVEMNERLVLDAGVYLLDASATTQGWYFGYSEDDPGVGGGGSASFQVDCVLRVPFLYVDDDNPDDPGTGSMADPFRRIQDAIDACGDGETVIIAPGIYRGTGNRDIDFKGKAITVRSTDPSDWSVVESTVIDCQGTSLETHRGFVFDDGETDASVLDGLTITNGCANKGGGIYCSGSSPTLRNCVVRSNLCGVDWGTGQGGGMYISQSSGPALHNCAFISNGILGWDTLDGEGGGVYIEDSNPTFDQCRFLGNGYSLDEYINCYGGAIRNIRSSTTLIYCDLINNTGAWEGAGGAIGNYSGNLTVVGGSFVGNWAYYNGGAIQGGHVEIEGAIFQGNHNTGSEFWAGGGAIDACNGFIRNCVICENGNGGGGGGISTFSGSLEDCIISKNTSGERGGGGLLNCDVQLINCVISENVAWQGGGLYGCSGTLKSCTISDNVAKEGWDEEYPIAGGGLFNCNVSIEDCNVTGNRTNNLPDGFTSQNNRVSVLNSIIEGFSGKIIGDSSIRGKSNITIGLEDELIVADDSLVDLNGEGLIKCDGLFRVVDRSTIRNASISVTRVSFEGDVDISNSVITAEAGAPYGQFFIEDTVKIEDNEIHADGDRYMDLDPSVFAGLIANNKIFVTITEGVGNTRGGLFELRGDPTFARPVCDPEHFVCWLDNIPAFDTRSWTLEELYLVDGAKVNLTNRFDFFEPFDQGGSGEVLYVKKLKMGKGAVLNTAYNHLYYENGDQIDPNAIITNEPLLGFSLNKIAFNEKNDFITRIVHNNVIGHPSIPNAIHVDWKTGDVPDQRGMIRMMTIFHPDPEDPTSSRVFEARAKGLFAKSSEDTILVWFEYLFENAPEGTELVIYLSEDPELSDNRVEVARLLPPPEGRPGSVGSGRFGLFQQNVRTYYPDSRKINFLRGTRVELELIGPNGTNILIDNWDPQIWCRTDYCKDVTGDTQVTILDYLAVKGEYGTPATLPTDGSPSRACLDGIFSQDGFVDIRDLSSWDWLLNQNQDQIVNLCAIKLSGDASGCGVVETSSTDLDSIPGDLVITGRRQNPTHPEKTEDAILVFNRDGRRRADQPCVVTHANSRLIQDGQGGIYQLNAQNGLVRLQDPNSLLPPAQFTIEHDPRHNGLADVLVGLQGRDGNWAGRPLEDVAFDGQGNVYVLPVIVAPVGAEPYMVTAQLQLKPGENPPYKLGRLYDDPPEVGENRNLNGLRDLELTEDGYLYVTNAQSINESSLLWVYRTDQSAPPFPVELGDPLKQPYIPGPLSLYASRKTEDLYLSSALNSPSSTSTQLYRMSRNSFTVTPIPIPGMGHITGITEDEETGDLWVCGFRMENIPEYVTLDAANFYKPVMACVSMGGGVRKVMELSVESDPNNGAFLPISVTWVGNGGEVETCGELDWDTSGEVGLGDLVLLGRAWLSTPAGGNWESRYDIAEPKDNRIDYLDLAEMARCWKRIR